MKENLTVFVVGLFVPFMASVLKHGPAMGPIAEAGPSRAAKLFELVVCDQLSDDDETQAAPEKRRQVGQKGSCHAHCGEHEAASRDGDERMLEDDASREHTSSTDHPMSQRRRWREAKDSCKDGARTALMET